MTAVVRTRLIAVAALLAAGAALAFIAFGNMGENLVYYWSPAEVLSNGEKAYGPTIRMGGIVKKGSIHWDPGHTTIQFAVADGKEDNAVSVPVRSTDIPPQMFREGIGVVVEGTFDKSGIFTSNRLMVNHSNEYRAPKAGEKYQKDEWKRTLEGADPQATARPQ